MTQTVEGSFNPSFHFLGLVQKAIADGITRHCVHPNCPEVYIVPAELAFYTATPDIQALEAMCLAAPFDLSVNPAPDWHPSPNAEPDVQTGRVLIHRKPVTKAPTLIAKPLSELIWYATVCASKGNLLQGAHTDTPIRLLASPDFSSLFHHEHDLLLAAFMLENNADLMTVCANTGVPLPNVFDFYNACAVTGLIEQDNVFNPAVYLPGLLEKANADKLIRRCSIPGGMSLTIIPKEGKYYTEMDPVSFGQFCGTRLLQMDVGADDAGGQTEEVVQIGRSWVRRKKAAPPPKGQGHPLSDLLFRSTLYASQGRLLANFQLDSLVSLSSQPDKVLLRESATIQAERYIFPLTAFMTSHKPMSLPEIAKATQQPLAKVIDFYNACAISGLTSPR